MVFTFKPRLQDLFLLWFFSQSWFYHIVIKIITFFFITNVPPAFDFCSAILGCTSGMIYLIYSLYYSGDIKKWQTVEDHHNKLLKVVSTFCCVFEAIVYRLFFLLLIFAISVPLTTLYLVESLACHNNSDFLSEAKLYINSIRCDYLNIRHSLNGTLCLVRILILSMLILSIVLLFFFFVTLFFHDNQCVWVFQVPSIAVSISDTLISFFSFVLLIACRDE